MGQFWTQAFVASPSPGPFPEAFWGKSYLPEAVSAGNPFREKTEEDEPGPRPVRKCVSPDNPVTQGVLRPYSGNPHSAHPEARKAKEGGLGIPACFTKAQRRTGSKVLHGANKWFTCSPKVQSSYQEDRLLGAWWVSHLDVLTSLP